jgi:hypothetical protein
VPYVYRYTDLNDEIIKYVGNVWSNNRTLQKRIREHKNDDWYKDKNWKIEYIQVNTRTDAEYLESHFIEKYKTYNYYNQAKAHWGISDFIKDDFEWKLYTEDLSEFECLKNYNKKLCNENNKLSLDIKKLEYELKDAKNQINYLEQNKNTDITQDEIDDANNELSLLKIEKDSHKVGRPSSITPHDIDLMFTLRKDGASMREIAKILKISVGSVHRFLNNLA